MFKGENVYFSCIYSGTTDYPYWNISGTLYSRTLLPYPYQLIGTNLHIRMVQLSMNSLTYSCSVRGFSTSGALIFFKSKTATLTVYESAQMSSCKYRKLLTVHHDRN